MKSDIWVLLKLRFSMSFQFNIRGQLLPQTLNTGTFNIRMKGFFCLSVCLSIYQSTSVPICLSAALWDPKITTTPRFYYLGGGTFNIRVKGLFCLSVCPSVRLSVCLSIDLSIYFCTCLVVCSSVRPPTKWQVEDVKPKRFCESSYKTRSWSCKNATGQRDFWQKCKLKVLKRNKFARLPTKMKCWRFFPYHLSTKQCACNKKARAGHTKCCTCQTKSS